MNKIFVLSCCDDNRWGYKITAPNLTIARFLVWVYSKFEDPYGHLVEPIHVNTNFKLIKEEDCQKIIDVNKRIEMWWHEQINNKEE